MRQGKAVEVTLGSGGQDAMVIKPIYIPAGVTLLVDGGVTLFGSRVAADYQIGTRQREHLRIDGWRVGVQFADHAGAEYGGSEHQHIQGTVVTGLMGYGVINGRGYDKLGTISGGVFTPGSASWWDNAVGGNEDNPDPSACRTKRRWHGAVQDHAAELAALSCEDPRAGKYDEQVRDKRHDLGHQAADAVDAAQYGRHRSDGRCEHDGEESQCWVTAMMRVRSAAAR
jgi:hypothetical protein